MLAALAKNRFFGLAGFWLLVFWFFAGFFWFFQIFVVLIN